MPDAPPSFTCPRCGRESYNPRDLEEGYCGACRDWTGREFETLRAWARRTLRTLSHPRPRPGPRAADQVEPMG